jgi:hypothetical protein
MTSLSNEVGCTAHNGAVWMHLNDVDVHISSHLVSRSKVLMDALSSVCESSVTDGFTLDVPIEWLQAWVTCCVREEEQLGCAGSEVLVNCLLVCFCPLLAASSVPKTISLSDHANTVFSARNVPGSALWCCSTGARAIPFCSFVPCK